MARPRRSFSSEFKREAAGLVLDQGYSVAEACRSLDVGETALRRWVDQLKIERGGVKRPDWCHILCRRTEQRFEERGDKFNAPTFH